MARIAVAIKLVTISVVKQRDHEKITKTNAFQTEKKVWIKKKPPNVTIIFQI